MPIKDLSQQIYNRITSPVSGVFLFFWAIYNWPILIIIIFGSPYEPDRVARIQEYLVSESPRNVLIIPLLTSTIYLISMPILRDFYEWFLESIKHTQNLRKKRDDHDLSEISQYRETLKAINSSLIMEIIDHRKIMSQIIMLSQEDIPVSLHQENLSQISHQANIAANTLSTLLDEHHEFTSTYVDRIPLVTRVFLKRWKNL